MFRHHHPEVQGSVGELQELRDAIVSVATHVLVVVRSHYPTIDLQSIGDGFAKGLSDAETQQLEDEVEDAAKKLAGDIYLFGETDGNGGAQ